MVGGARMSSKSGLGFVAAVVVGLSGCGSLHQYATPEEPHLAITMQPHVATYDLMGPVQGKACRNVMELSKTFKMMGAPKTDENWIGNRTLYEEAKYAALESVHADNLMFVRAHAEFNNDQVCVTITGRAYKILTLKAPSPLGDTDAGRAPMTPEAPHP